ncbi:MAG: type II toxin-antitoxin system RelE/ParE family toxin [Eubacterium sp.]
MYKITVTEPAQRDLAEAITYISKELKNRQAAVNLLNSVDKAVRSLSDMPERYAVIDDEILGAAGFRFIKIKSYLLFYIVRNESKTVVIQRFLYARRDWLNILKSHTSAE